MLQIDTDYSIKLVPRSGALQLDEPPAPPPTPATTQSPTPPPSQFTTPPNAPSTNDVRFSYFFYFFNYTN